MVNEIPAYCGELHHRQDRARTRTEELLAVADTPFEHEADLGEKEHELAALTAQLHLDANSPHAHARAEETRQRLATRGRTPGWSLALNPTPAMLAEYGREELVLRAGRASPDASGAAEHGDGRAPGLREDAAVEDDGGMDAVRVSFPVSATEAARSPPGLGGSARAQPYRGQEYERGGDFGR